MRTTTGLDIDLFEAESPEVSDRHHTLGWVDYVTVSRRNYFPLDDYSSKYFMNNFVRNNLEFYYYHQPYLQSMSPHGSIINGWTVVLVVGAWFDYKPEYWVIPYCRFWNKVVPGVFLSTVRITCVVPEYDTPNVRVPFEVSLNWIDFTDSGLLFTYYNDYRLAKFHSAEPSSGPNSWGTNIKIFWESFTSLLNPEEFLCEFFPTDSNQASR